MDDGRRAGQGTSRGKLTKDGGSGSDHRMQRTRPRGATHGHILFPAHTYVWGFFLLPCLLPELLFLGGGQRHGLSRQCFAPPCCLTDRNRPLPTLGTGCPGAATNSQLPSRLMMRNLVGRLTVFQQGRALSARQHERGAFEEDCVPEACTILIPDATTAAQVDVRSSDFQQEEKYSSSLETSTTLCDQPRAPLVQGAW